MKLKLLIVSVFIALLCMAVKCEKEDSLGLPLETQIGANTFGCLVDDEIFVKSRWGIQDPLWARYDKTTKTLKIRCIEADRRYIHLRLDNPTEKEYHSLTLGYFSPIFGYGNYYLCENSGQVFITKFDTINSIVSGTFEFLGKCVYDVVTDTDTIIGIYCSDESTAQITKGRFDIKLDTY